MHNSNINKNNQSNTIIRFNRVVMEILKENLFFLKCINTDILLFMSMN